MDRLRLLLNQQMVSAKTTDVFLNEICNRPTELLVKLVEDRESLNSILNQMGVSPGFDRVGVVSALEMWSQEYESNKQLKTRKEKKEMDEKEKEEKGMELVEPQSITKNSSKDDVQRWLQTFGNGKFIDLVPIFKGDDGSDLLSYSESQLKDIIKDERMAIRLYNALQKYQTQVNADAWDLNPDTPLMSFINSPPWTPKEGKVYGCVPKLEDFPGWPTFCRHPQYMEVLQMVQEPKQFYILGGRRRVGKSFLILSIAKDLMGLGKHVLYVEANIHSPTFLSNVTLAVDEFDSTLTRPTNIHSAFRMLWWLMHSGVWVIIDEFQRLGELGLLETLQSLMDKQLNFQGSLICLGSHVTQVEWLMGSGQSPLYGRPHNKIEIFPFDYGALLELFNQLSIPHYCILDLVSCFDGIIGMYYAFFKIHNFITDKNLITFENLKKFVTDFFLQDRFYQSQLHDKHALVLEICAKEGSKISLRDRLAEVRKTYDDITKAEITQIIASLVKYGFLLQEYPLSLGDQYRWIRDEWKTANPSKQPPAKIRLLDAPLRFSRYKDETELHAKQGFIFEEICRSVITHYKSPFCVMFSMSPKAVIHCGFWDSEPCTEIDVVFSDEETKTVVWGSCKCNSSHQSILSLMSHVVSFFNNRGYDRHPWFNYRHIFLFLSPQFTQDQKNSLKDCVSIVNSHLASDLALLEVEVKKHLSNFNQRSQNPFVMSLGAPTKLFCITSAAALDFDDFVDFVQNKNL